MKKTKARPRARRDVNPTATQAFFTPLRLLRNGFDRFDEPLRQHSWTYACIKALASNIAQIPLQLMTGDPSKPTVVEQHEFRDTLDNPNPLMVDSQLKEAIVMWLSLSGYVGIVKEGKGEKPIGPNEVPSELWPLDGKCFEPEIDKRTKLPKIWVYRAPDGSKVRLEPHQVTFVRYYDPNNPYGGLAPMDAALLAARSDFKALQFNEAFFENDATPGGLIMSEKSISDPQRDEIKTGWEDRHQGRAKRRRVAILGGGLKYQELGITHREMEFKELRNMSIQEIAAVFKVPKSELALHENLNFATAQSADKGFWTKTLLPIMRLIAKTLTVFMLKPVTGGKIWLDWDWSVIEALREDYNTKIQSAKMLFDMGVPINVINERLSMELPPLPHDGVSFLPAGMQTVESIIAPPDPEPVPVVPPPEPPKEKTVRHRARNRGQRERFWQETIRALHDPLEPKFRKRFQNYLYKLRVETLKLLEKANIRSVADALFDEAEWNERLVSMHHPLYVKITANSLDKIGVELGSEFQFGPDDPKMKAMIEAREDLLVQANSTIRGRIKNQIEKGLQENESLADIRDRVRTVFNGAHARASMIARTEVAGTVNAARFEAMGAAGVEKHEWVSAHDEAVRESHQDVDGEVVEVGEPFSNGLKYPNELGGPAAEVINCRCIPVPIVPDAVTEEAAPHRSGAGIPINIVLEMPVPNGHVDDVERGADKLPRRIRRTYSYPEKK